MGMDRVAGWSAGTTEKQPRLIKLVLQISFFARSQPAGKEGQGQASQQGWEGRLADSPPLPDHCKLQVRAYQTVSLAALAIPQRLACTLYYLCPYRRQTALQLSPVGYALQLPTSAVMQAMLRCSPRCCGPGGRSRTWQSACHATCTHHPSPATGVSSRRKEALRR